MSRILTGNGGPADRVHADGSGSGDETPTITNTYEGVTVEATKRIVIPALWGRDHAAVIGLWVYALPEQDSLQTAVLNGVADTEGHGPRRQTGGRLGETARTRRRPTCMGTRSTSGTTRG